MDGTGDAPIRPKTYNLPQMGDHIRKVAVTMQGEQAQFIELDQNRPLAAIIRDVSDVWTLAEPDDYALQYTEPKSVTYITERNRFEILNGNVLRLTFSPSKTAQEILERLHYGKPEEKLEALKQLSTLSRDITFAVEFINKQGLNLLISMVEGGSYSGDGLAYTLKAFVELMDHGIVSWDVLEPKFIKTVSSCVSSRSGNQDPTSLQSSLEILESIVLHSTGKVSTVEQEVTPVSLLTHLSCPNQEIQKSAIALINALFLKADPAKRKKIASDLQTKSIRNVILNNIIQGYGPASIGKEMAHQLYVLQNLLFSLLEERRMTKIHGQEQIREMEKDILELRKIAFDIEGDQQNKKGTYGAEYKRLGFENQTNPLEDFQNVPPGVLALDNMVYFARNHGENYTKVVLEGSRANHDCPFAKASIELTKMLCEILSVGELPTEEGHTFYPMFFTHDKPFEEFYSHCIQLLNKTWKEMRATSADFVKVLSVVKEQITRALASQPSTFDAFRNKLAQLTYSEITELWKQERQMRDEFESQAKPVVALRERIKPEILNLIKQQRLNTLMEGSLFTKYSGKGRMKDKFWYCRLSPNLKYFYYGDCSETSQPPALETLPQKLAVVDIKALAVGKDCPHFKDKASKRNADFRLAFTILSDTADPLNFVAPSDHDFNMWTDGINALLGNQMVSSQTNQDLETLLSMEIKLRLLDTEGIPIPNEPPPIPREPPNYNFYYK